MAKSEAVALKARLSTALLEAALRACAADEAAKAELFVNSYFHLRNGWQ